MSDVMTLEALGMIDAAVHEVQTAIKRVPQQVEEHLQAYPGLAQHRSALQQAEATHRDASRDVEAAQQAFRVSDSVSGTRGLLPRLFPSGNRTRSVGNVVSAMEAEEDALDLVQKAYANYAPFQQVENDVRKAGQQQVEVLNSQIMLLEQVKVAVAMQPDLAASIVQDGVEAGAIRISQNLSDTAFLIVDADLQARNAMRQEALDQLAQHREARGYTVARMDSGVIIERNPEGRQVAVTKPGQDTRVHPEEAARRERQLTSMVGEGCSAERIEAVRQVMNMVVQHDVELGVLVVSQGINPAISRLRERQDGFVEDLPAVMTGRQTGEQRAPMVSLSPITFG